uniref:Small ribosomal subunit protein mS23 conserved domain-containing protein n=1 Tax=Timema genevievae TaxID=629358 RepID=A0A7R9JWB2_TIMGE|nr:unnamed protein product [Timema genevievae]
MTDPSGGIQAATPNFIAEGTAGLMEKRFIFALSLSAAPMDVERSLAFKWFDAVFVWEVCGKCEFIKTSSHRSLDYLDTAMVHTQQGLLRSGAMKQEDKPLWYHIYESFPPKYEPSKLLKVKKNLGSINLLDQHTPTSTQKFLNIYNKLKADGQVDEDRLFDESLEIFNNENKFSQSREETFQLANALVVLSSTAKNEEIVLRILVGCSILRLYVIVENFGDDVCISLLLGVYEIGNETQPSRRDWEQEF